MAANLAAAKASETIESRRSVLGMKGSVAEGLHVETLIIYKLGFNQNYQTFALMLLIKIVLLNQIS
jgi:hypothetical protein